MFKDQSMQRDVARVRFATTVRQRRSAIMAAAVCAVTFAGAGRARATNGTWTANAGTASPNWSSGSNWAGGNIASGSGAVADFSTLTLTGNDTVHLNAPFTVGQLNFGDKGNQFGWTLDNNGNFSNVLTLASGTTSAPVVNVTNQTATISAGLTGTQGFTLTGGGTLALTGASSYTGVTNVASGTLVLGSSSSGSSAPAAGALVDLDPQLSTVTTSAGVVTGVSDLSSTGTNSATSAQGSVTLSTINGHKAFSFNGAAGLSVPTYNNGSTPETVFAVINPSSVTGPSAIVAGNDGSNYGGLELRLYQSKLGALDEGKTGYAQSTSNVPAGGLSVIAYSFNSSGGTYYLNGTAIGTTAGPSFTSSNPLTIGYKNSNNNTPNEFFSGSIGTVLIYGGVLSQADFTTTENFLASEYATSSSTLGTTLVNLTSTGSNLAIASSSQSVSSLAGVAGSNIYLGGGILSVGSDGTSTNFAGNISDTGTGAVGTGGQLVKVGAGTLTLAGTISNTGGVTVTAGTLAVTGSYTTVGPTAVTGGTMSITGIDSDTGSHTISGGTLSIAGPNTTTGSFAIGSTGTLSLAGPSTATGPISFSSSGTLTLVADATNTSNTGSANVSSAIGSPSSVAFANAAVTNVQLRSDGSVTFANSGPTSGTGSGAVMNFDVNNLGGTSTATGQTLTLGGTTAQTAGGTAASFATYQTTINVTGGHGYTLAIPAISNANNSYLNLNASTANLSIGSIGNIGSLTVTGASNTTIGGITGPGAGGGSLLKTGAGVLSLTGANTYTGSTNISGGTMSLGSAASLPSTSSVVIASGATFDISANPTFALSSSTALLSGSGTINGSYNHSVGIFAPGGVGLIGTLAVNGTLSFAGGAVDIDLSGSNNSAGGTNNDLIAVNGPLNLVGSSTLTLGPVNPTLPSGTTWTVITYTGSAPTGTGTLNVSSSAFSVITVPGAIELKYNSGAVAADLWTGNVNNNWDTSTTNFVPVGSSSPISYTDGDSVVFNDSATQTTVNLSTVNPSSVTVNTSSNNYVFTGGGSIGGNAFLTKLGSSTLTINTANTYAGTTTITGGTIILTNTSGVGLGTGPLVIGAGATLQVGDGGADGAINPSSTTSPITDNGLLAFNSSSSLQPPSTITGTGSVYYNVGYIGVGNVNTYSGGTTIAGGEVEAYEGTSFGTGPVVVNGGYIASNYGHDFPNTFNLSGMAVYTGNYTGQGNAAGYSELGGATVLAGDTTISERGGSGLIFGSTVTAPNNNNLILNAGGNGVIFDGNVSLGTGQIESSTAVQLNPASGTTITISSVISGSGSVSHIGSGTSVLTAVNTYSGGTTVSAGLLQFAVPGAFPVDSPLTVTGGTAQAASSTSTATKNTIFASGLTITQGGVLDLTNNDLLVQSNGGATTLAGITSLVSQGYNYGRWNGATGIISTTAASNSKHLTALGVMLNDNGSGSAVYSQFDGQSTSDGDVLVKYTYYGDANLDGKVDGSDYSLIDAGYSSHGALTGWQNGDFNYDGVVDGSDYALIDNTFNNQGVGFGASASALTAASTAVVAAAVPEPASIGILAIATFGLTARRRRQQKATMTA